MPDFFSFFIVLLAAVLFSRLFSRMRVPWVVALIIGGIAIGPHGLDLLETDRTMDFIASIGLVFLMFMAGLETRFSKISGISKSIATVVAFSSLIPGAVGVLIAFAFGYSVTVAVLLGIIFMASSIGLLVPSLEAHNIIHSRLGSVIIGGTVIVDATSLVLLSVFLQILEPSFNPILLLWYPLSAAVLVVLAWLLPKIRNTVEAHAEKQDLFERELRLILLMLIGLVVLFELMGLHAIIAGFFSGIVLSQSIGSRILKAKLHAIGYGFFIPVFFVVLGSNTNIRLLLEAHTVAILAGVIVIGSLTAKLLSGWLAGKISGFTNRESMFLGTATIPSLSTTLAVAFLGFGQGLFDQALLVSVVFLTIVTSIVAPLLVNALGKTLATQQITLRGHEEEIA